MLDFAFAWYLPEHVMGGYKFLMQNYITGDKVCLFGAFCFRAWHRRLSQVIILI